MANNKIGIMGGTFDPIHYGHLITAETVREEFGLDKILFIPAGNPPHKNNREVTDAAHRLEMLKLAVCSNCFFEVSEIEIERFGYTYTVDTLSQLKESYGEDIRLFFIVGADVIPELITWKSFKTVFTLCEFIAVLRPGSQETLYIEEIKNLKTQYGAIIHMANAPLVDISSTVIRHRENAGKSIRYLLPEKSQEYIRQKGLYRVGVYENAEHRRNEK